MNVTSQQKLSKLDQKYLKEWIFCVFFSTDCSNSFSSSSLNKKGDWWDLWVFEALTGGRQLESFLQRDVRGRLVRTSRTKGGDHASEKIRAAYRVLSSFKIGSDLICAKTSSKLGLGQIMSISKFQHTILNTHKYNTPPTNTQTAIPLVRWGQWELFCYSAPCYHFLFC